MIVTLRRRRDARKPRSEVRQQLDADLARYVHNTAVTARKLPQQKTLTMTALKELFEFLA